MTAPLRRAHRWIWLFVALALFTVLTAGVAARRDSTPRNESVHWKDLR